MKPDRPSEFSSFRRRWESSGARLRDKNPATFLVKTVVCLTRSLSLALDSHLRGNDDVLQLVAWLRKDPLPSLVDGKP